MNIKSQANRLELVLKKHQLLTLKETQPKMAIECKQGVIWVTHSGESQDYLLRAGRHYIPNGKGSLVIEALDDAYLHIHEPN